LATQTASYRAHNLSHKNSLDAIANAVEHLITPISTFKIELESIPALKGSFQATMRLRAWIRRHRFNHLIDIQ